MASGSQAAGDGGGGGSGGKFMKRRRTAVRKTPYDRPTPPLQPENPNWFDGLVSPAKFVAGGASKLFSSIWNPKSWASHSSSSDSDSDSEGVDNDYEDTENLSEGGVDLNQKKGSSSGKSEILYLVEQLLMLESYSREECDRLIEIINSRAVDSSTRDGLDAEPSKILSRNDNENPDICNQAIEEARKLITENMVGLSSKSDLDSIHCSKSLMRPNVSTTLQRDYLSGGSGNIEDERAKATEDDLPIEALSSLPTIKEQNQMVEEDDVHVEVRQSDEVVSLGNREVADVSVSLGSSNTNDPREADSPQPVRRSRRYSRRGRGRAK